MSFYLCLDALFQNHSHLYIYQSHIIYVDTILTGKNITMKLHNIVLHICRDDSDKLMKSMSYLDEAKGLLDQYDDKDYHILWNTFKMWYYKGDTNKSLGKYRDSQ